MLILEPSKGNPSFLAHWKHWKLYKSTSFHSPFLSCLTNFIQKHGAQELDSQASIRKKCRPKRSIRIPRNSPNTFSPYLYRVIHTFSALLKWWCCLSTIPYSFQSSFQTFQVHKVFGAQEFNPQAFSSPSLSIVLSEALLEPKHAVTKPIINHLYSEEMAPCRSKLQCAILGYIIRLIGHVFSVSKRIE